MEQEKLDNFINKNYNKIVDHYKNEGLELGYEQDQLDDYIIDVIDFTYIGTEQELKTLEKDYYIIAQDNDMVIAETFSGHLYYW